MILVLQGMYGTNTTSFLLGWGGRPFSLVPKVFPSHSQCVPHVFIMFHNTFPITLVLYHMFGQMLSSSYVYRWAKVEECHLSSTLGTIACV